MLLMVCKTYRSIGLLDRQHPWTNSGSFRPPPPFGQPPPPFSSSAPPSSSFPRASAMARPGPPPLGSGSPPQTTFPPNLASNRPSGPPPGTQPPPPFGARPPPPGSVPSSLSSFGARPPSPGLNPFGSSSLASGLVGPPSSTSEPVSNGPPPYGWGAMQGGPRFPSAGSPLAPPVRPSPPTTLSARAPPPAPSMGSLLGSPPTGAPPGPMQAAPFSAPPQGVPPPSGSSPFSSPPQGMPPPSGSSPLAPPPQGFSPPSGSPYGHQAWAMHPQQVAPPPLMPGSAQAPRMFGMPPQPSNQAMATISPAMGPMGSSMAVPSKIDPNQIPRPMPSSSVILHETRQGNQANLPPPSTSDYIVKDTGNSSPRYLRCTINQIPCTVDLLTTSGMQLALMVQPLALPHPSEEPIQVVDFGESGPVRCSRCKGYINPFMKFIDQGRRFICNLCGFTDETPRDYQCNLGPDGRRRDADERPELCRGTVEFIATKEYMVRDPMPAVFFFLIDVSMNAIQTGATAAACSAINQVISDLPEGPRTMVGIATFDSTIHFYNLKRALQQVSILLQMVDVPNFQSLITGDRLPWILLPGSLVFVPLMLIVPDVQDVYTPLQTDVIVQLSECRQHLELLLENIPTMFHDNRTADSAFGAAVKAAFLAMKSTGGKLIVFQIDGSDNFDFVLCCVVLPSVGIAALSAREAEGRTNISAGEKYGVDGEDQLPLQVKDVSLIELKFTILRIYSFNFMPSIVI
ncbi:Sec23/Sec24 protein transport family protein [Actinidia rufa]|uniref:Sec23/Sec24 protein transport family protein n=1 Tax=Actinidia rufa TaxID=165716 RepID=A0A7J0GNB6_9ERIC|nr:Sec23/Sec24 protein transport family protein [Actinidia rufa]